MTRIIIALVMLALMLFAALSFLQDMFAFEDAWEASGASQHFGTFGFKGATRGYIKGVSDTLCHIYLKSTLRIRAECRVLTASFMFASS